MSTAYRHLAALGLSLSLLSCQQEIPELKPARIAVAQTPLSSPFFIAQEADLFTKCGIEAELVPINGGKRAFDAMISGDVSYSTSSDSVVSYAVENNQDFNILASFASSENDVKLISNNTSLPEPTATLGYWGDSSSEHLLRNYLALYSPDQQYSMISRPPEQLVEMFNKGTLDIISVWEPFAWQVAQNNPTKQAVVLDTKSLFSLHFMLLSRPAKDSEAETSQRVLAALALAINEIYKNPEQAKKKVNEYLGFDASFIEWVWEDYLFQLKSATSLRYALLSNSYQFNESGRLDYSQHLNQAYDLPDFESLIDRWCIL